MNIWEQLEDEVYIDNAQIVMSRHLEAEVVAAGIDLEQLTAIIGDHTFEGGNDADEAEEYIDWMAVREEYEALSK